MVLVDAGSASASEVLVGALSDNHRARVIGSCTFGKGSVQTLLPLDNGDSVKLTTARYYTPSGRSIQARGLFLICCSSQMVLERLIFQAAGLIAVRQGFQAICVVLMKGCQVVLPVIRCRAIRRS